MQKANTLSNTDGLFRYISLANQRIEVRYLWFFSQKQCFQDDNDNEFSYSIVLFRFASQFREPTRLDAKLFLVSNQAV